MIIILNAKKIKNMFVTNYSYLEKKLMADRLEVKAEKVYSTSIEMRLHKQLVFKKNNYNLLFTCFFSPLNDYFVIEMSKFM